LSAACEAVCQTILEGLTVDSHSSLRSSASIPCAASSFPACRDRVTGVARLLSDTNICTKAGISESSREQVTTPGTTDLLSGARQFRWFHQMRSLILDGK